MSLELSHYAEPFGLLDKMPVAALKKEVAIVTRKAVYQASQLFDALCRKGRDSLRGIEAYVLVPVYYSLLV